MSDALDTPLMLYLARFPNLYYILRRKSKLRDVFSTRNKEIVIEGFPRSANTFAVLAFQRAQGRMIEIAHHVHSPAQVIRGIRLGIPSVVLIRQPEDAVVSFVMFNPAITVDYALLKYRRFYEPLLRFKDRFVIAPFDSVIHDFASIIDAVNKKFATDFSNYSDDHDLDPDELFKAMEKFSKIPATDQINEWTIGRPSETRARKKPEVLEQLRQPDYQDLLNHVLALYSDFVTV